MNPSSQVTVTYEPMAVRSVKFVVLFENSGAEMHGITESVNEKEFKFNQCLINLSLSCSRKAYRRNKGTTEREERRKRRGVIADLTLASRHCISVNPVTHIYIRHVASYNYILFFYLITCFTCVVKEQFCDVIDTITCIKVKVSMREPVCITPY